MGNAHPNICPYAVFPTKDGHIIIAVGNDGQFERLCKVLELPQTAQDERFITNQLRVKHRDVLTALLEAKTSQFNQAHLLSVFEDATVPAAPINNLEQLFSDPQLTSREMVVDYDGVPGVRTPIKFSKSSLSLAKRAPKLGEDSQND